MALKQLVSLLLGQAAMLPLLPTLGAMKIAHERAIDRLNTILGEYERAGTTIDIDERELR